MDPMQVPTVSGVLIMLAQSLVFLSMWVTVDTPEDDYYAAPTVVNTCATRSKTYTWRQMRADALAPKPQGCDNTMQGYFRHLATKLSTECSRWIFSVMDVDVVLFWVLDNREDQFAVGGYTA